MTAPIYCTQCEQMTHPTYPHSCYNAAAVRALADAERAVIDAAKGYVQAYNGELDGLPFWERMTALQTAVAALVALEGAQ